MSQEDSPEERQTLELQALQSIYGENIIKDLREKSSGNKWIPLNFSLTLTPQQGNSGPQEVFVHVDLHLICNYDYPNSVPSISLENSRGLSETILVNLQQKLQQKASELVRQEMIFELCQLVEEFLHQHNKPPSKSLYDQMLYRKKIKQERDLEAQQIEQDRQRKNIFEEVQQIQEKLKTETRKRREIRRGSDNDSLSSGNRRYSDLTLDSSGELCNHRGMTIVNFGNRVIHRGQCINHSSSGCVSYTGIDKETGELVDIGEWMVQINTKNDLTSIQKQIYSIKQELTYILSLKHPNLGLYYDIRWQIDQDCVIVDLLREFMQGTNCYSLFFTNSSKPDMDFLKHIAKEVLTAIEYLHRNRVVHRDIDAKFVFLCDKGVIKLTNYSIHRRLSDLNLTSVGNYSQKMDILKYGLFVLSLVQGRYISEETAEISPRSMQSDLFDFLIRCLAKDECDRYTASELLNHSFFHISIEHFSPKHEKILEMDLIQDTLPNVQDLAQSGAGQSRLANEFENVQHLGKGAFGDVIKVRNKLDDGYYAIKRIQLNPKNKSLNKKIIREVKLLSRLNHENVVRYYNSWIETTTIKEDEYEIRDSNDKIAYEKVLKVVKKSEFTLSDQIQVFSPIMKNVEVSVTYDSKSKGGFQTSSDEDSSSDEDEPFKSIYREESDSDDGIEFLHESKSISDSTSSSVNQDTNSTNTETKEIVKKIDYMYIQMEFCDKSTLRTAIDDNLFLDRNRVWRLFREIVEGLAHIHQQGMIHRDLKPVNIFLDSEDHVKIGDFGLATTTIKSKQNEFILSNTIEMEREDTADESKTGCVGTALYVAPEICESIKVVYNEKVDIYSLGIILFEMFYRPLATTMERINILTKLRSKDVILPEDFIDDKKNIKQVYLIRWLLSHDISKRPTSSELLQSEHIPPPVLEERELREMVRHTVNNPQLKGYKYLIASCFTQSITTAQNITYDKDPSSLNALKSHQLYDLVKHECIKIFEQHCAQNLPTPLLMPKSEFYDDVDSCVKLMTHFGSIVCLPHDLRVPFARYVAWNEITFLRRYSVERVYREKKVFGFHPRELYECAFDIVTPASGSLIPDAEILYIVCKIINELPALKDKRIVIKLNHVFLLQSILLHFGIKDKHQEVYKHIADIKASKISKNEFQNYLISRGLSDSIICQLLTLLNGEYEYSKAAYQFQMIMKKKAGDAGQLAHKALEDLKVIISNAEYYGAVMKQFDIVISPSLTYNIHQYSGMICQFVCEVKKKHKHHSMEVLAAGGRYDSLVAHYRKMAEQANLLTTKQTAVGISISLDKMVQVIQRETLEETSRMEMPVVAVCSVGSTHLKEGTKILNSLRMCGIKGFLLEMVNKVDIEEQTNEIKASHIIMLKNNEPRMVRVKSLKEERFQSFNINEVLDNPRRILQINDSYCEVSLPTSIARSDSKIYNSERNEQNQNNTTTVDILFSPTDKVSAHSRRRYDGQVRTHLEQAVTKLSGNIIVIALQVETNIIKTLALYLEFESEKEFQRSAAAVVERHQRYPKDLHEYCVEIYEQKTKKNCPIVVLYSLVDNFYRVII